VYTILRVIATRLAHGPIEHNSHDPSSHAMGVGVQ